jgi:hypothetical protein
MQISEILKIRKKSEGIGFVVPIIEQQSLLDSITDSNNRKRDVFHPSEISRADFCPRAWLLCQRDVSLYDKNKINPEQQLRFDVGKILHKYVQEKLGNSGVLFGAWECLRRCEGEKCFHLGFKPKNICDGEYWVYKEVTVFDDELNIRGNTDGIIIPNSSNKWSLEFKSMNTDSFSTLVQPIPQDEEQACWYLDILYRKGFYEWNKFSSKDDGDSYDKAKKIIDMPFTGAVVMYMNKNTQVMREFFVNISALTDNKSIINKKITDKKKILGKTISHLNEGTLIDRLYQCDEPKSKRAKRCIANKLCFQE